MYKKNQIFLFNKKFESDFEVFQESLIKILTSKEMLQSLAKALAQVKAGNPSKHLLNEIREIVYLKTMKLPEAPKII